MRLAALALSAPKTYGAAVSAAAEPAAALNRVREVLLIMPEPVESADITDEPDVIEAITEPDSIEPGNE